MSDALAWSAQWIQSADATRLPMFRREFQINAKLKHASISICGLGHFQLHINGQRVGDDVLSPAWTNYAKTCLYMTYDVELLLRRGANCIGVMLGNGMYNVTGGRYRKFKGSF